MGKREKKKEKKRKKLSFRRGSNPQPQDITCIDCFLVSYLGRMYLGGKGILTVLRAAIAPRKPPVGLPSAIYILIQSPNHPVCFHTKIHTEHSMAYLMILDLN